MICSGSVRAQSMSGILSSLYDMSKGGKYFTVPEGHQMGRQTTPEIREHVCPACKGTGFPVVMQPMEPGRKNLSRQNASPATAREDYGHQLRASRRGHRAAPENDLKKCEIVHTRPELAALPIMPSTYIRSFTYSYLQIARPKAGFRSTCQHAHFLFRKEPWSIATVIAWTY